MSFSTWPGMTLLGQIWGYSSPMVREWERSCIQIKDHHVLGCSRKVSCLPACTCRERFSLYFLILDVKSHLKRREMGSQSFIYPQCLFTFGPPLVELPWHIMSLHNREEDLARPSCFRLVGLPCVENPGSAKYRPLRLFHQPQTFKC